MPGRHGDAQPVGRDDGRVERARRSGGPGPGRPLRSDVGGDQAGTPLGGEPASSRAFAARAGAQVEPEAVPRRGYPRSDAGQRRGPGRPAGRPRPGRRPGRRRPGRRVTAGQPQAVGRPAGRGRARRVGVLAGGVLAGGAAGGDGEDHVGPEVAGRQGVLELGGAWPSASANASMIQRG